MLLNCGVGEDSWEFLALQEIQLVNPKGNQSWMFLGRTDAVKLQYFGHLIWRADSSEKTLMLGRIEGRKRRGQQKMRWLDAITDSMDVVWVNSGSWWWTERPGMLQSMGLQRVGHNWVTELNWNLENILQNSISTYIYIHRYYLVLKHSVMPDSLWFQASLSLEFPRQEDWSKLPFLPPGDLPGLPGYLTHISSVSCIGRQILYH